MNPKKIFQTILIPSLRLLEATILFLSSCALAVLIRSPHQVQFDETAFAGYSGMGTATVTGQIMASDEGETTVGAGVPMTLMPVTRYTQEMVDRVLGDGVYLSSPDPRFKKYERRTTSDNSGRFTFTGVPAGEYFVFGEVSWSARGNADLTEFQWACERITVRNGAVVQVMVTHNPQHGNAPVQGLFTLD